jgi:serine/threonine protein kinase
MTERGHLVAERYRLDERVGAGAMGVVWAAYDERLGRTIALKQLQLSPSLSQEERDEALARTMREARLAARLHHPNVVSVYDVVDENGAPCLVMEYVPSRSLDAVLRDEGALTPERTATIGVQVATALAAAHAAGVVHRDVKPGNVLLGAQGVVKISDFGISRAADDVTITKTGLIAGTPAYLAPEVAIGRNPTAASDMFSLGSTLYAAVEGEPPFGLSENTLGLLHAVAAARINPPRQAGPLTPVLEALLSPDPQARPDAQQARRLLEAAAEGRSPMAREESGASSTRPYTRAETAASFASRTGGTAVLPAQSPSSPSQSPERPPATPERRRSRWPAVMAGLLVVVIIALLGGLYASGAFGGRGNGQRNQGPLPAPATTTTQRPTRHQPGAPTPTEQTPTQQTPTQEPTRTGTRAPTQTQTQTTTHGQAPTETGAPTQTQTTTHGQTPTTGGGPAGSAPGG